MFNLQGGWWCDISDSLRKEGLRPIESDFTMIKAHLEVYFDASQTVQMEQMCLSELNEISLKNKENDFISQITSRITQDTKTAIIKKNSRNSGRLNPFTKKKF